MLLENKSRRQKNADAAQTLSSKHVTKEIYYRFKFSVYYEVGELSVGSLGARVNGSVKREKASLIVETRFQTLHLNYVVFVISTSTVDDEKDDIRTTGKRTSLPT
jgi:hypothetical protein